MAVTSGRMDNELIQWLERTAEKLKRSKNWLINDAVIEYLEREEFKDKMVQDTQQALADVEAGRMIDGELVLDWLETWGQSSEKLPPKV